MAQKKLFYCENCSKSYTTHSNLNVHFKRIHPEITSASNLKGAFIFKSVTYENEYSNKQILKQHGSKTNHPAINEDTDVTKTLYTCKRHLEVQGSNKIVQLLLN
ncbi:uncharacterized protein LOC143206593 isoform X2 [Rhynchophorus ferrugineus]|uniref:uncharacterized protein LOC143206593 isoform X2 n=1 Tax=Rhynchophorus ferrugineus TaxID=354439 RepID=UPI003FCC41CC